MHTNSNPILVALDTPDLSTARAFVTDVQQYVGGFKVGLELCCAAGVPAVVNTVAAAGGAVFLDLKLHDIPNTVAGAVNAICSLGPAVRMLTLHTHGGTAMLRAAVAAVQAHEQRPLLLGVTVLTSLDTTALATELQVSSALTDHVLHLAQLAQQCGLDGVVASPHEAAAIRGVCGPDFLIVTPGVRPVWAAPGDQRRVLTPAQALHAGADYLVIGRPITAPPPEIGTPAQAAARIAAEIADSR